MIIDLDKRNSGGGGVAGVSSVNGKSGKITLDTINGKDLTAGIPQTVVQSIMSGEKGATIDSNGRAYLRTINGESLAGDTDIKIEGGSGDYSIVDTLPEATKEGQIAYLSEDMTHQQPVTGVGGKSMEFGETGEGEYHIIQYGDADLRIYRDGDGNIIRVWSRDQDLPFSLDGTWYKLDKSFTGHKDAFYMFNGGWFWFYVYEGEEFATNDYGGGTYAAGETCDYVDTIVDYEKGQYIAKKYEFSLYTPKVQQGTNINNTTISFPDSYKSTFESEELMIGFEWFQSHPDLFIGANAEYVRYSVPQIGIDEYIYLDGQGQYNVSYNDSPYCEVHISYKRVDGLNVISYSTNQYVAVENPVSRGDEELSFIQWVKYDFPAKVFVYDDREGADHSEIANALAPYYVAQETGGQAAVGELPRDLCVIYKGIAYYGPFSESDWDRELRMGSKTISFNDGQFVSLKLIVEKSGNCREIGGDFSLSKPVYVTKEGIEGFDGATKITFKFNDGYEWYWDKELTTRIFIDGYERDLNIRPANYGEEYRINVKCQDWFDKDSIIAPDGPWDYNKLVKYETNEYSIFWVASFDYDTRTATIYIKSGRNDELAFVASDSLQTEIDANHIEVSVEDGASVATVPSELSFKTGEGDKKVVFPTGVTSNDINSIIKLSQEEYDALEVKDDKIFYIIVG